VNGRSYNRLCSQIIDYSGPTFFIVTDSRGHLFGAYVSETWTSKATFRSDTTSLLFSLVPEFKVYRASGLSSNNIWLYNNRTSRTDFPLGIGFGGKLNHFRLWIDEDLMTGQVNQQDLAFLPSLGYITEPADLTGDIKIGSVEVWGCGGESAEMAQAASKDRKAQEIEKRKKVNRAGLADGGWESGPDKFIMDIAGKTGHADGYLDDLAKIRQMKKQQQEQAQKGGGSSGGGGNTTTASTTTATTTPAKKEEESEIFFV